MLDFSEAPKKDITCQGLLLTAPMPYNEGHELTAEEAAVVNQTWLENLRNNYSAKVKKACEEAKVEEARDLPEEIKAKLIADFPAYVEGYEFGARGGREADPVKSQAKQLAVGAVKAQLKANGYKISDVGQEKINAMADTAIEQNPAFLEKAAEIVAARQAAAEALTVDL